MGRHGRGFTLIELMIVVSIVGLLSTLAGQEYYHMTFRAKRSELTLNLDGIRTAEIGYQAEWAEFTSCALSPVTIPGRTQVSFPATIHTQLDWNELGWVPDGRVYGQYQVTGLPGLTATSAQFEASAFADIDGDGNYSHYLTNRAVKPQMLTQNIVY